MPGDPQIENREIRKLGCSKVILDREGLENG